MEGAEVPPPPSPHLYLSAQNDTPPVLYCSLKTRQRGNTFNQCIQKAVTKNAARKDSWLLKQLCDTEAPHPNAEFKAVSLQQVGGHGVTCHGCELQKGLCRHFNCHAALLLELVTFDGELAFL